MPSQPQFHYKQNNLFCEAVPLARIAADVVTPVYIYSKAALANNVSMYQMAVSANTLICYATKANGNPTLLHLLSKAGLGADVTSGGELFLAKHSEFPTEKIIYSGVGKTKPEIEMALDANIRALHVESEMELAAIAEVASERQQVSHIGVRVNPNIDAKTHPYISTGLHAHKFGVSRDRAAAILQQAASHPWLEPVGLAAHIGSQITDLSPYSDTARFLVTLADELAGMGIRLDYLDVGGGLGIDYGYDSSLANHQNYPAISDWVTAVSKPIIQAGYDLVLEPGRSIVGSTGALLTQVVYTKNQGQKQFIIADAGMNDLLRPTLYQAHHPIWPIHKPLTNNNYLSFDIVGPICESSDFLAKERPFPPTQPGDLLAIMQAGAYGFAMASNYNGRLRPAEVLVDGDQFQIIRQRQTYSHLLDGYEENRDEI